METVRVKTVQGVEERELSVLPEGSRLEYFAAKQFLQIYNETSKKRYEVDVLQDCPDVACCPSPFFIEVATIFDTPTDAPKILGRAEGIGGVREIHAAIRQINSILENKASKRYGVSNCFLVIRHGVPIFSGKDFRMFIDEFDIPQAHEFTEIYLLAFREKNGLLQVGSDLIRLFPSR